MANNILTAESSFMAGNARVQQWQARFLEDWLAPIKEAQLVLWWDSQPPEMHEMMRTASPQAHAEVEKKVMELKERSARNAQS